MHKTCSPPLVLSELVSLSYERVFGSIRFSQGEGGLHMQGRILGLEIVCPDGDIRNDVGFNAITMLPMEILGKFELI